MKPSRREIVGSFNVLTPRNEVKRIVISQDLASLYSAERSHSKYLHLDSIEGAEVKTTEDPDVFELPDGTRLRKTKPTGAAA